MKIAAVSHYLPENIVSNKNFNERQKGFGKNIQPEIMQKIFGIEERRFAHIDEQVSCMAAKAAEPIVKKVGKKNIDLLIFAAACSDLIEPATSNIVQYKLGLECPVMDIKNACNSFVTAIQVASAFMKSGMYKNILITNGEKLSDSINYHIESQEQLQKHLAAFSFGDAGTSILLSPSENGSGVHFQKFLSIGKHWELCTIKSGGSMFPHDLSKTYFEGHTSKLKDVILLEAKEFIQSCFKESGWTGEDIDYLFTHQVSVDSIKIVSDATGVPLDKCVNIFPKYGNTAAASIPLSISLNQSKFKKGDKVAVIGLAAGISASVQLFVW